MKKSATREWKDWILENGSYKLVALFVTLILWVTILGRRDFPMVKEMRVEFLLPRSVALANDTRDLRRVLVKVSGPRMSLAAFDKYSDQITIDLRRTSLGNHQIDIGPRNVEVPTGVRVLSVTPREINVTLVSTQTAIESSGAGSLSGSERRNESREGK